MSGFRFVLCLLIFIACDHNYDWQQFLVMCYNNCLVLCVIGSSFNLLKFLNFTCHWLHVVSVFNFTLCTWPFQNTWWIWEKIASCRKCQSQCAIVITIIPRAQMGSEPIAHDAEGRMSYWLRGHDSKRNNCFSKVQLAGEEYWDKTTLAG